MSLWEVGRGICWKDVYHRGLRSLIYRSSEALQLDVVQKGPQQAAQGERLQWAVEKQNWLMYPTNVGIRQPSESIERKRRS